MKAEKTAIQFLTITAVLLLLAVIFLPKPATAQISVRDADYSVATYPTTTGSDALYIAESRSGMILVVAYDPSSRSIQFRARRAMADAFPQR